MPRSLPVLTLLLAAISVGVYLLPAGVTSALQFDRQALASGELWRLATAHLTHFDANHLAWDVGALLALGSICERASRSRTAITLGLASVTICVAVWVFQPQFESYRGLSGLDSALFGLFASSLIQQRRRAPVMLGVIALLGVLAKSIFEMTTGTTAFALGIGYSPVPLAHLVGVASGIASAFITSRVNRKSLVESIPIRLPSRMGRGPHLELIHQRGHASDHGVTRSRTVV